MRYSVVTTGVVKSDISEALEYYNAISLELAIRFGGDLFNAFNRLEYAPHNYFNLGDGCRRVNLQVFPYLVLYNIDEEAFIVKIWRGIPPALKSGFYKETDEIEKVIRYQSWFCQLYK